MGVAFAVDAASGMPAGLASAVVLSLLAYWTLQCISYWWWCHDVMPQLPFVSLSRLNNPS